MRFNWVCSLSDGSIYTYKDLYYPGGKSPWLILVEMIREKNISILRNHFNTKDDYEILKQKYYALPFDVKPKTLQITNLQLVVNGVTYSPPTDNGLFPSNKKVSHFWIYQQTDFTMAIGGRVERQSGDFISVSFLVDRVRVFQWVDKKTGQSWTEVVDYNDSRNLKVVKEFLDVSEFNMV